MSIDFLWQDLIWLVIGLAASKAFFWTNTRLRRRRLRAFFGQDALGGAGIAVSVPVLRPLSGDNFDPQAEATVALKSDDAGREVRRPIYGEVLHLADYQSAEQVFALLREQGARNSTLVQDSEALGGWSERPCLVCVGSPFVNATFGELLRLDDDAGARITGNRASDTLDTYRVEMRQPENLSLGVEKDYAIGVIARLRNPAKQGDWVVGVWGDRAESTFETARYFRTNFRSIAGFHARDVPLIVLLAIRGSRLNVAELMYAATDRVLMRNDELLRRYVRSGSVSERESEVQPEARG